MFETISTLIAIDFVHPNWLRIPPEPFMLSIVIIFFSSLLILEMRNIRNDASGRKLIESYRTNIMTFLFNDVVMTTLSISSLLLLAEKNNHFGLIGDYTLPIKTLIAFFFLDLILYIWHRANHRFECLWMFHKVHHSDQSMNASTAFRVHFIDIILTTLIKGLFIVIMGVEVAIVAFWESVTTLFTMLHHTSMPLPGEKWLKNVFIVPSLHRTHHSVHRNEHDSNYGAILSLWDRIFGTHLELQPEEIGLKNIEAKNFLQLLKFGFITSDQKPMPASLINLDEMIAEAAYYKAEKRGFAGGFDIQDWLDAEKETLNMLA